MAAITFEIPWEVKPKQSMRFTRTGHRYQPAGVKQNEAALCMFMGAHRPAKPLTGPLRVCYTFRYAWRAGESKKRRAEGTWPKDTSPDLDNLSKQLTDCAVKSGFMLNDGQIAELSVRKLWCDRPGVGVTIEAMQGEQG